MTALESSLVSSYERLLTQAVASSANITDFKTKVKEIKKANFVPKFMEYRFCDMQLKYIHQAFAKHLSNLLTPYFNEPMEL
jgi:UDP-galactopyranose mutase